MIEDEIYIRIADLIIMAILFGLATRIDDYCTKTIVLYMIAVGAWIVFNL